LFSFQNKFKIIKKIAWQVNSVDRQKSKNQREIFDKTKVQRKYQGKNKSRHLTD